MNLAKNYPQGWSPEPEEYKDLPPRRPSGHDSHTKGPYLQINLLQPYNITGKPLYHASRTQLLGEISYVLYFRSGVLNYWGKDQ